MTPEQIQAAAAVATFLAAALAVWATFKAPERAAKFAEDLRRANHIADEERRTKLEILTTLLRYRARITSPECVGSINMIDIAFRDAAHVRSARKSFLDAASEQPCSNEKIVERFLGLIEAVAQDLGFSDQLTKQDLQSCYHPIQQAQLDEAARLQNEESLKRLRGTSREVSISPRAAKAARKK